MAPARRLAPALLAVAFLHLTACTTEGKQPAKPDAADAEAAVRDFYGAFAKGDFAAACESWTSGYADESVKRWNDEGYGKPVTDCPGLLEALTGIYKMVGDPAEQLEVTDATGTLTSDTTARVDVKIASSATDTQTYELTLTNGNWLISGDDPGPDMLETSSSATTPQS